MSSNSSKPPSSEIVQPPKPAPKRGKKRRQGGQLGHTKYERTFRLEDADVIHDHRLDRCPTCASDRLFHFAGAEQTHYQYELVENRFFCMRISPTCIAVRSVIRSTPLLFLMRWVRPAWSVLA